MEVLAIIPARSGSKSIPNKNIMSINGKPLLSFSIEHALKAKTITRTIISTDSEYYAEIASSYGAEVPFLRPNNLSLDNSTDLEVFTHALIELKKNENYVPDIIVQLRPTCPYRESEDIDNMVNLLIENNTWDSVRSVVLFNETPYKMWHENDGLLIPVAKLPNLPEAYNEPRQKLPPSYLQNAAIDVTRPATILNKKSMTGDKIGAYIMQSNYDIDTFDDSEMVKSNYNFDFNNKTFCFDIDGIIANLTPNNDYNLALPNTIVIKKINELYNNGNYIILFTARGSKTGLDWTEITKNQMDNWGVKYHELKFGKPAADYYIDDRLIDIEKIIRK